MAEATLYKIVFVNQNKVYEVFAKAVVQSGLFGFIEISDMVFEQSTLLIDPAEEKLKSEFKDVRRTYIPMHSIIRIDEVKQQGTAKILDMDPATRQVLQFPTVSYSKFEPPKGGKPEA